MMFFSGILFHKLLHPIPYYLIGIILVVILIKYTYKYFFKIYTLNKYLFVLIVIFLLLNIVRTGGLIDNFNKRSKIVRKINNYFSEYYDIKKDRSVFVFVNERYKKDVTLGQSKQIHDALGGSDFFKIFYKDKNYRVYYEDLDKEIPEKAIRIGSWKFLEQK